MARQHAAAPPLQEQRLTMSYTERMCYLGSIDDWIEVFATGLIGNDEFFELY